MRILLYGQVDSEVTAAITAEISDLIPAILIDKCVSISGLIDRLKKNRDPNLVMVIVVTRFLELVGMTKFKSAFANIRTIFVLPDRDKKTIDLAHRFHPRFLTDQEENLTAVAQVLEKMIKPNRTEQRVSNEHGTA